MVSTHTHINDGENGKTEREGKVGRWLCEGEQDERIDNAVMSVHYT